jgi:formate/nitrite transporter FocA (FNT family)
MIGYVVFAICVLKLQQQDLVYLAIGYGALLTATVILIYGTKVNKRSKKDISIFFTIIFAVLYVIWAIYLIMNHDDSLDKMVIYFSLLMLLISMFEIELVEIGLKHYYKGEKVLREAIMSICLYLILTVTLVYLIVLN